MSGGFLLGLLVGAWAGFLFGLLFLAAWMNIKRADEEANRVYLSPRCEACGSSRSGSTILHVPGCSQESPVRRAFL